MAIEMGLRGIRYQRQVEFPLLYKGHPVGSGRLDFLVEGCVILEMKAVGAFNELHTRQMISYLAITGHPLGLILNFNVAALRQGIKRIASRTMLKR